ncbi:undecaprenyl-diphosphate phosphatase [Flavobacteriaceae bacterium UJ101]|nr:undecaprenyl-diphosphate phosphatase [Flavobacteriaceae bacterium UJ101]
MNLEHILELDSELLIFLNNLGSEPWDGLWLCITYNWSFLPLYILGAYLLFKSLGKRNGFIALITILLLFAFTSQMTQLAKHFFERPRPCRTEGLFEQLRIVYDTCGRYGFFSGHACNSFGFAVGIGLILRKQYRNLIWILLLWASVVAYSRIYVGVHFPLDIICGALFGTLSAFLFYRLYGFLLRKYGE